MQQAHHRQRLNYDTYAYKSRPRFDTHPRKSFAGVGQLSAHIEKPILRELGNPGRNRVAAVKLIISHIIIVIEKGGHDAVSTAANRQNSVLRAMCNERSSFAGAPHALWLMTDLITDQPSESCRIL